MFGVVCAAGAWIIARLMTLLDWMELHNLIFHGFTYTFAC